MRQYYYSFNEYLKRRFKARVQRISLNAGFGCPNRDRTLGAKGCIFCNEEGFTNFAETTLSLEEQIKISIDFFKKRFGAKKFIAYFQNSTNTYADTRELKNAYDSLKSFPDIVGLFISTRPDCIDEKKLNLIESYADKYEVWIEYGLQSIHDRTLKYINRAHTYAHFLDAVRHTSVRKIKIGAHIILGLPGESRKDMIKTADAVSLLPLSGIKIHVLHVLRGTELQHLYQKRRIKLLKEREYINLVCDFLEHLNPKFVIMRLVSNAKNDILMAPRWINDKQRILNGIDREFKKRNTHQGARYEVKDGQKAGMAQ